MHREKRRSVLFADGVAPGNGTSASESDADDNNMNKSKKLSARAKTQKNRKNNATASAISNEPAPSFLEKENMLDAKVRVLFF